MKFLIVFACALAAASAGHILAPIGHNIVHSAGYHGPQHLPIIDHEGVPVDTADVQVAKAAHLSHKINVAARNGDLAIGHHVAPIVGTYAAQAITHPAVLAHSTPIVAHSAALAYNGVVGHSAPIVAAHHGLLYRKRRGIYASAPLAVHHTYHGAQHIPLINHEGVPVDTAEVQIARSAHLAHKINIHHRNGDHAIAAPSAPVVAAYTTYAHAPVVGHHTAPFVHVY